VINELKYLEEKWYMSKKEIPYLSISLLGNPAFAGLKR
jgi:hypothetical protein